jgi:hypothetical protein
MIELENSAECLVWRGCFHLLGVRAYVDVGNIAYLRFLEMLFDFYFFAGRIGPFIWILVGLCLCLCLVCS